MNLVSVVVALLLSYAWPQREEQSGLTWSTLPKEKFLTQIQMKSSATISWWSFIMGFDLLERLDCHTLHFDEPAWAAYGGEYYGNGLSWEAFAKDAAYDGVVGGVAEIYYHVSDFAECTSCFGE